MKKLNLAIVAARSLLDDHTSERKLQLGFISWVLECRTLTLGVPRRTGKTTAIRTLADSQSIILVHSEFLRNEYLQAGCPGYIMNFRSESSLTMLRYALTDRGFPPLVNNLFIDEYELMHLNTWADLLGILAQADELGRLSEDFYIMKLGT
jgi:hypothetical protein